MSNLRERVENKTKIAIKSEDAFYFESQNELFSYEGVDVSIMIYIITNQAHNHLSSSSRSVQHF